MAEARSQLGEVAKQIFDGAIARVQARPLVARALTASTLPTPVAVFSLGKVAVEMAEGARDALGDRIGESIVVAPRGSRQLEWAKLVTSGHPLLDADSLIAGAELIAIAERARQSAKSAVVLLSGGGSALAEVLDARYSLEDVVRETESLLKGGAPIEEINKQRRMRSRLKGGGLARALVDLPGTVLVLCDVPSGDPAYVSSGPMWYRTWRARHRVIADMASLAEAACAEAAERGIDFDEPPPVFGGTVEEAAQLVANWIRAYAGPPLRASARAVPWPQGPRQSRKSPFLLALAGEPTIAIRDPHPNPPPLAGREIGAREIGGRAQHLALRVAELCAGLPFAFLAAGSDGRDGATDHAGALVTGETAHESIAPALAAFDSARCCESLGVALPRMTTGTHLGDLHLALVG